MKKDTTAAERVKRYEEKKRAAGFVRVPVWVPKDKRQALHDYARQLRAESVAKTVVTNWRIHL